MVAKVFMDIMCISLFIFVPFVRVQKNCVFLGVDVCDLWLCCSDECIFAVG